MIHGDWVDQGRQYRKVLNRAPRKFEELCYMSSLSLISVIRDAYRRGENVLEFLKDAKDVGNDREAIMISYDLQAGSYTRLAEETVEFTNMYTDAIAKVWSGLGPWHSAMEVGVGEATRMLPLMDKLDPEGTHEVLGFDISWSRCRYAHDNVVKADRAVRIFVADLFEIPLADNSVDIVYTSHSLEPNGGREAAALRELFRVARKYVVLLEPDYTAASDEGKARMRRHGYVRDLGQHARELGYDVVEERPFDISINPLNPTGLTVIRMPEAEPTSTDFVCPVTRSPLVRQGDVYFSPESGLLYPVIDGQPCLLESSATLGLHFGTFNQV
jgi:ubiquinone/menaquinone biosynthesis C-methylase UbiE